MTPELLVFRTVALLIEELDIRELVALTALRPTMRLRNRATPMQDGDNSPLGIRCNS